MLPVQSGRRGQGWRLRLASDRQGGVVHTDDLCRALDLESPFSEAVLREVMAVTMEVATPPSLVAVLRAATGRTALPAGFSVLG